METKFIFRTMIIETKDIKFRDDFKNKKCFFLYYILIIDNNISLRGSFFYLYFFL